MSYKCLEIIPLVEEIFALGIKEDSEYCRNRFSSIDIGRLLAELIEDAWDPEDEDDSDGETGPLESKFVDMLREERLFIALDAFMYWDSSDKE